MGQHDTMKNFLNIAEQLCPNNIIVILNKAEFFSSINDSEKEEEYYKKAYDTFPRSVQSCYRYAMFKFENCQDEEAINLINEGIVIDPQYIQNYELLADVADQNNEFENAIDYLQKCIKLCPEDGNYHYKIGEYLLQMQLYDEAITYFNQSIKKIISQTRKVEAHQSIAYCHFQLENFFESFQEYFSSFKINVSNNNYQTTIQSITYLVDEDYLTADEIDEVYQKYIQNNLTFQSQYSHLDLYLD
ncbi:hypothetical protein ABPG72_013247 [Tetrahymena utriculariae]